MEHIIEMRRLVDLMEAISAIDKNQIIAAFRKCFTFKGNISVNEAGEVNVTSCQKRDKVTFTKLPVKFGSVGEFNCISAGLQNLNGCPASVTKDFVITGNNVSSLEGCPSYIGGSVYCVGASLRSLNGSPEHIPGDFHCSKNNLRTLEGGPKSVGGSFDCELNPLKSLEHLPATIGGYVKIPWSPNLPLLRLLQYQTIHLCDRGHFITALNEAYPGYILRKYNKVGVSRGDIIACQKELMQAGFEGNASW